MADTLALNAPTVLANVVADEAIDGLGNTSVYQWIVGSSATLVSPPGLEYGINHPAPSTYAGPVIGTITTTDTGAGGPITANGTTYNTTELFKSVNSASIFPPTYTEIDVWAVLGVGPVQLGFPDNVPALICPATTITLH